MATMNVSIPDSMKEWVERQAEEGRFSNSSDYIRALIRQDREQQQAIAILQAAIDEGLSSGPATPFDADAFKMRMRDRAAR